MFLQRTIGKRTASADAPPEDWAHGGDCSSDNLTGCVGGHGEDADSTTPHLAGREVNERWINPPPATIPVGFGTACSLETCDMCPSFPGCDTASIPYDGPDDGTVSIDNSGDDGSHISNDTTPRAKDRKRWVTPITTLPTNFGTACSLETCDMCPTFPGCGSGEPDAGQEPELSAAQNWAQPPRAAAAAKREVQEDPATRPPHLDGNWRQPPSRREKRKADISPIVVSGGVEIGAGPECSVLTCDLCPDHPGCSEGGQTWDSGNDGDDQPPK